MFKIVTIMTLALLLGSCKFWAYENGDSVYVVRNGTDVAQLGTVIDTNNVAYFIQLCNGEVVRVYFNDMAGAAGKSCKPK